MGDNFCIYSLFSRCLPSFRRSCSNDWFLASGRCPMLWPPLSSTHALTLTNVITKGTDVSLPSKSHSLSPWELKWHIRRFNASPTLYQHWDSVWCQLKRGLYWPLADHTTFHVNDVIKDIYLRHRINSILPGLPWCDSFRLMPARVLRVYQFDIVGSLCDRQVACSVSKRHCSNSIPRVFWL